MCLDRVIAEISYIEDSCERMVKWHELIDTYDEIDGYPQICLLCGEVLVPGKSYQHFSEYHPEWWQAIWLKSYRSKPAEKERRFNPKSARKNVPHKPKPKPRTYLKPWQDPESLFCDRKFLSELIGKEIADGDECRDARRSGGSHG